MNLFLDIHDLGIKAVAGSGGLLALDDHATSSPGVVWLNGKELVTGQRAVEQAVLHPLHTCTQFWDRLDTAHVDPVAFTDNYAELAAAHISRIWQHVRRDCEAVVMLVPPQYSDTQLGILAAIAQDLQIPLKALVPSPLALAVKSTNTVVINLYQHRSTATVVTASDALVELKETRVCDAVGQQQLSRRWADAIAAESVRTNRFDPLHSAASEAALHAQLPQLMAAIGTSDRGAIELQEGAPALQVTDATAADWTHGLTTALVADVADLIKRSGSAPTVAVLNHPASLVPGLKRMLAQQLNLETRNADNDTALTNLRKAWPDGFGELPSGIPVFTSRVTGVAKGAVE